MPDAAQPEADAQPEAATPPARRFTIGDAMILIAAGGLALVILRLTLTALVNNLAAIPFRQLTRGELWNAIEYRDGLLFFGRRNPLDVHSVAAWSLLSLEYTFLPLIPAFLVIRLRRPRPPFGRLIGEPGPSAVAALVAGIVVALATSTLGFPPQVGQFLIMAAIPATWAVLVLRGRWRRGEPRWLGRMGLILGWFWCIAIPLHLALMQPRGDAP